MLGHGLSPTGSSTQLQQPGSNNDSSTLTSRCRTGAVLPAEAIANLENSPSILPRRLSLLRVKMATAKFKSHFHAPHGHKLFRANSSNNFSEKPIDEEQKQREKDFISCYECNGPPLTPDQIAENPRSKEVGLASKQLRVGDFELIKTIGTGGLFTHLSTLMTDCLCQALFVKHHIGTFARVWLACLAGTAKEGQKVFALKVLRKVDSTCTLSSCSKTCPTDASASQVIRLKQVEHIKNERNTLSVTAGHPFITTMITSFSDKDCLYMLVRDPSSKLFFLR